MITLQYEQVISKCRTVVIQANSIETEIVHTRKKVNKHGKLVGVRMPQNNTTQLIQVALLVYRRSELYLAWVDQREQRSETVA